MKMNLFESRYFNLNCLLLSLIGLWPYQKLEFRRIKMIFILFLLAVGITAQLMSFITIEYSRDLLIKVFCYSFIVLICIIQYNMIYFKSEQVKYLFEQVLYNWNSLTDAEEIEIIRKYANKGRLITIFAGFALSFGFLISIAIYFISDILNIVAPLNESRRHQLPVVFEVFFDQEKHYLFIILNASIISFVILTVLFSIDMLNMICIQHACGLLKLTSHRILKAIDDRLQQKSMFKSKCIICIKLSKAIKIHTRSIKFVECLCSLFSITYFITLMFIVASLSINLFEFLKAIESKQTIQAMYIGVFLLAHFGYMFWINYFGQNLIDHSADVFVQIYNVQWYKVSPHIQKKILFILHRSSKNIFFDIGSIFSFSLDGIATLINSSVSFTMLLYSTRT